MAPRLLSCSLLVLALLPVVTALGVVPSSQEVVYEPGKTVTYPLKIVNSDGAARQVLLYVEGELSGVVSLDRATIDFSQGDTEELVTVTVKQPSAMAVQGKREGSVVVREIPRGGGQITASLTVSSKLYLVVPYTGTYAEMRLFVGEFERGKTGNFVAELSNLGTEDIAAASVYVKVYDARTDAQVASLVSGEERVERKSKKLFTISWTPDVPNGAYRVVATASYDGRTVEDQKALLLGRQSIAIESITVKDFRLGGIARFDILLRNEWSDEIKDVHAEVAVRKGESRFASSATQTVTLEPLGSQEVSAYWDTDKVVPGNYELEVSLFYGDQVAKKTFPITVTQDRIDTGFTGQAVSSARTGEDRILQPIYLLIVLVIIVLVVNIMLFRKLLKKKA